jgi:hypothetical protein
MARLSLTIACGSGCLNPTRSGLRPRRKKALRGRLPSRLETTAKRPWRVETAKAQESSFAVPLLDAVTARGFRPGVAVKDMGSALSPVYEGCEARGCHPVIPCIPLREPPAVKAGKHKPATWEHGEWTFAGADAKRRAAKWRCPTGECSPASRWIGASRRHTLIPRGTVRCKKLYRQRGPVEREFGRLKNDWALLPLRVRRIDRVRLHADLTMLARLATALANARAVPPPPRTDQFRLPRLQ